MPRHGQLNDPDDNIRAYTARGPDWPFNSADGSYDVSLWVEDGSITEPSSTPPYGLADSLDDPVVRRAPGPIAHKLCGRVATARPVTHHNPAATASSK